MIPTLSCTASNPEEVRFEVWLALNAPHDPEEDGTEPLPCFSDVIERPHLEGAMQ